MEIVRASDLLEGETITRVAMENWISKSEHHVPGPVPASQQTEEKATMQHKTTAAWYIGPAAASSRAHANTPTSPALRCALCVCYLMYFV